MTKIQGSAFVNQTILVCTVINAKTDIMTIPLVPTANAMFTELKLKYVTRCLENAFVKKVMVESVVITAQPVFIIIQNVSLATVRQPEAYKQFAITKESVLVYRISLENDAISA